MPFKSKAQMKYLAINEPEVFKRWKKKYGVPKSLPKKKSSSRRRKK